MLRSSQVGFVPLQAPPHFTNLDFASGVIFRAFVVPGLTEAVQRALLNPQLETLTMPWPLPRLMTMIFTGEGGGGGGGGAVAVAGVAVARLTDHDREDLRELVDAAGRHSLS